MHKVFVALTRFLTIFCTQVQAPDSRLPFFNDGHPRADNACRRVGKSADTSAYPDHVTGLIDRPEAMIDLEAFGNNTGPIEFLRLEGYALQTVPHDD